MFLRVGFELVKGVFLNYLSSWGLLLCCGGKYKMIFMTLLAIDIKVACYYCYYYYVFVEE